MFLRYLPFSLCGLLALAGCGPAPTASISQGGFGRFEGDVVATWDLDGRNMTLRENFAYIDAQGRRWTAPAGSIVNGASIPRAFWSVIGGPFEGRYRNASVVHDVECHEMRASWEDVHRMFYEACLCGGVDEAQAKMMYYAVYHFGPRWQPVQETRIETRMTESGQVVQEPVTVLRVVRNDPPPPTAQEIAQVAEFIAEDNPEPEVIQTMTREELHRRPSRWRDRSPDGSGNPWPQRPRDRQPRASEDEEASPLGAADGPRNVGNGGPRWPRAGQDNGYPPPQYVTPGEQEWATQIVQTYLEQQASQALAAEYTVFRSRFGFRVFVQYLQHDENGQAFPNPEATCIVRLSPEGQVLEVVSGAEPIPQAAPSPSPQPEPAPPEA